MKNIINTIVLIALLTSIVASPIALATGTDQAVGRGAPTDASNNGATGSTDAAADPDEAARRAANEAIEANDAAGDAKSLRETGAVLPDNLPKIDLQGEQSPVKLVERVLLRFIIQPIFFLAGGVAIIIVMYSSFRLIAARGEEEGVTAAKKSLIWALVGLALVMLSYTIISNLAKIIAGFL